MPLVTSRFEMAKILDGKAEAITRWYHNGECPHKVGDELIFGMTDDKGKAWAYAIVVAKSIRPCSLSERMTHPDADEWALREGFTNHHGWYHHMEEMYGKVPEAHLFRIQFNIKRVVEEDRTAGKVELADNRPYDPDRM